MGGCWEVARGIVGELGRGSGEGPCLSQGGEHGQTVEASARVEGNSLKLQSGHGAHCSKSELPLKGGLEVRLCFCNHISFLLRGESYLHTQLYWTKLF